MYKNLNESINTEIKKIRTKFIKNTLTDLKRDAENAPKVHVNKTEENNKIIGIVEFILYFDEENQKGGSLIILTPNQMLRRLPISLTQLKAGNNSKTLKNEIRQLLYSLYRSKEITKQLYKSLTNII